MEALCKEIERNSIIKQPFDSIEQMCKLNCKVLERVIREYTGKDPIYTRDRVELRKFPLGEDFNKSQIFIDDVFIGTITNTIEDFSIKATFTPSKLLEK